MHEISLMTNILDITAQEMRKHGAKKLISITVRHGILSNIVPDSMSFAFEALTLNTPYEGAKLILVEEVLSLQCFSCSHTFAPIGKEYLYIPCPSCQTQGGFKLLAGEGIFLDRLEAE